MKEDASPELLQLLRLQKYHLVGAHSAVKSCRWMREALVRGRPCYKQRFYGIKTHRCMQITPAVHYCNMHCAFCWRAHSGDKPGLVWKETPNIAWEEPKPIVEGCVSAQLRLLSGYKGHSGADKWKLREAMKPRHVAISLTGEPTLYPRLGEMIHLFHMRGFTTFLVSNGTLPEALSRLREEPTQLYISLCAYDEPSFLRTCHPQVPKAWTKLNETLDLMSSFRCPTVLRLTLARHLNLARPEAYARLIERANPTYIEPKAYMHVGFSRLRLSYENTPSHMEIRGFAEKLAKETGYNILDEVPDSRVVLLSRLEKAIMLT